MNLQLLNCEIKQVHRQFKGKCPFLSNDQHQSTRKSRSSQQQNKHIFTNVILSMIIEIFGYYLTVKKSFCKGQTEAHRPGQPKWDFRLWIFKTPQ